MFELNSLILAAAIATTPTQTPPIFNPGAPGAQPRVITAEQAVAMSQGGHTEADAAFMRHMLVHHAQALEMVELLRQHGQDASVLRLGERIAASQDAEMQLMREWLSERGLSADLASAGHHGSHGVVSPAPAMEHHHHEGPNETPLMPGMLSEAQMVRLSESRGAEFDRLFLQGMTQHHQGAIDMVDALLETQGAAEEVVLSEFLNSVVADQSAEIQRMQSLLSELQPPNQS